LVVFVVSTDVAEKGRKPRFGATIARVSD